MIQEEYLKLPDQQINSKARHEEEKMRIEIKVANQLRIYPALARCQSESDHYLEKIFFSILSHSFLYKLTNDSSQAFEKYLIW